MNDLAIQPGFWDWDTTRMFDLLARLVINSIFVFIIARALYFPKSRKREYFFTYMLLGFAIFMLIHVMNFSKMKTGIGLGLFGIFCIMRYRTESVSIREMTYIFIVIALAAINAMGWELTDTNATSQIKVSEEMLSIVELFVTNTVFVLFIWIAEIGKWVKGLSTKYIRYDKIDLITPEKHQELIEDLHKRTGLNIKSVEIGSVDFLKDMALIKIYYTDDEKGLATSEFKMPKEYA